MADVTPRHYLYGIIIMMFFIVGGMAILSEFQSADSGFDTTKSGEFNRTFNKLADAEEEIGGLRSNIEDADADNFGAFGVLNTLIQTAWNSLKFLFSSFGFMDSVFDGLTSFFGVPAWIPIIIGLFITVTLVFSIYNLVFGRD